MNRASIPRACYIRPSLLQPVDRLAPLLDRCASLGFAEVVLPCPFVRDDQFQEARLHAAHRLSPAYGFEGDAIHGLSRLAAMAADRELKVILDIRLDEVDGQAELVSEFPSCFRPRRAGDDALPDPRQAPAKASVAVARFRSEPDALVQWWQERMLRWCGAGVAGFRCLWPQRVPTAQWAQLMSAVRGSRTAEFWAWTPGLDRKELEQLAGCNFDAAFSSLAWWDLRAGWFLEEDEQLRRFPASIAVVNDPWAGADTGEERMQRDRRALHWAAAAADGFMVALGADGELDEDITKANQRLSEAAPGPRKALRPLLGGHSGPASAWLLKPRANGGRDGKSGSPGASAGKLLIANADLQHIATVDGTRLLRNAAGCSAYSPLWPENGEQIEANTGLALEPGEVRLYQAEPCEPLLAEAASQLPVEEAAANPRVAIEGIAPSIDAGRFPIKRTVGERVTVQADAFSDGHDLVAAALLWREAGDGEWQEVPMRKLGNDRWSGEFTPRRMGRHEYTIEAWRDEFATARMDLEKKRAAGKLEPLDVDEVCQMISQAADASDDPELASLVKRLSGDSDMDARCALLVSPEAATAMARSGPRPFRTRHRGVFPVEAEREAAGYSSWYELFPRSQSTAGPDGLQPHGTFDDVIERLPAIRDMGFDVLYMPPIHPIGRSNRKGRNNSVTAQPGEPGSPYAIGAAEGGHDAVHPDLGTLDDFRRLVAAAADEGLELALDFAIQCSPDHPWLREHPDWFAWRADGSIRYAENPPKKYEDIVNVDFYAEGAVPGLWLALRDVVAFWVNEGVRLFRVDNPHTKPFPFWEWMIGDIRARHPDVVFLSEAFTRPKLMYRLAKVGYSQSYTYFTWRNTKADLTEYLTELDETEVREYFRPHFFVNTPDINPVFLQRSGRPGHLIRAALATTLSGLWGMYSGFELCEATPLLPGKEDYLDSEKYQLRDWDWQRPGNIIEEITRLNRLRRMNPALQTHLGVKFYNAFNENILYFGKRRSEGEDMVLVAINLDPHQAHEADFELPLWEWGLGDHESLQVEDLWRGTSSVWTGKHQHLRLDPEVLPFSIWRVGPNMGEAA